jgi:two-component system KDP operon response regulator KdpE
MKTNSVQAIVPIENANRQKTAWLFREHSLINPLITHILESLGFQLIFIEDLELKSSSRNILMPSIIVLDDCLSAAKIVQNINVIKTQFNAPIIYLTDLYTRQIDQDEIFQACNDFILKPFSPEELRIRIEYTIRRFVNKTNQQFKPTLVERRQKPQLFTTVIKPDFYVDKMAKRVYIHGQMIHLTPKEYSLFVLLSANVGHIYSTEDIIKYLWPDNKKATQSDVQQFIYCLRKKIEKDPKKPTVLHNVPGYGYKLESITPTIGSVQ